MIFRCLAVVFAFLLTTEMARAENPGSWDIDCSFTCNLQGYQIVVVRPPDDGSGTLSTFRIVVVRDNIHEYGNASHVMTAFGTMDPQPDAGYVSLYNENQTPATQPKVCTRDRQMLTGRVYEWERKNTYQFNDGETPELHDSSICGDASLAFLRNLYMANSGEWLPDCFDVACSTPGGFVDMPKPEDLGGCGLGADNKPRDCPDILGAVEDPRVGVLGPQQPQSVRPFNPGNAPTTVPAQIDDADALNNEQAAQPQTQPQPVDPNSPAGTRAPTQGQPDEADSLNPDEITQPKMGIWKQIKRLFRSKKAVNDEDTSADDNEQDESEDEK